MPFIRIIRQDAASKASFLCRLAKRSEQKSSGVGAAVGEIIEAVKAGGDAAVIEYTQKFDGAALSSLEVTNEEKKEAFSNTDGEFIRILERARDNIREYHEKQLSQGYEFQREDGAVLGRTVRGLSRVGIYVPGGTAAYPSSVLMNAVPARVAGVGEIIMTTPPDKGGKLPASILAAAEVAGVDRIFKVGGAQAIAAMAYGTQSVPAVDKIVGPGNIYVAEAKRQVFGKVDIDMIAGPSEILIIADDKANPAFAAADMMSQAEHDTQASAVLLCFSEDMAQRVCAELESLTGKQPRAEYIKKAFDNYGAIFICESMGEAVGLANEIAPEHLEILCEKPFEILKSIKNAGSVFLGEYAPEPLGDYLAGTNHVLPTGGTARFFSPLSVDAFLKKQSYIYYTKKAFESAADDVIAFADREGLYAHANSVRMRQKYGK